MPKIKKLTCFKAYDIRGEIGNELNSDIAYRIGCAIATYLTAKKVVVGADMRLSSEKLKTALTNGLLASGADVIDIGMTGSEEVYFATKNLQADAGIEITASHNPINYNGMKLVAKNCNPISANSGLNAIKKLAETNKFQAVDRKGIYSQQSNLATYVDHLISYIEIKKLKPIKLVVNAGNGAAGHVIDAIEQRFNQQQAPIEFIKINHQADGNFPNGIPNPLLSERRADTANAVIQHKADLGIAWDGDFDRCFLFDEQGNFIESYYIVGLLAEIFLQREPQAKIIHDPRLSWNTVAIINAHGGKALMSKTGHTFIKEKMREQNAIYGGEMSGHHYFRDFYYCDSGMIPWLLIVQLLSVKNRKLSNIVKQAIVAYPVSGEINLTLEKPNIAIKQLTAQYEKHALAIDNTDGVSMEFNNWRFNLRMSNTEPLVRLNVEARNCKITMQQKTQELVDILTVN